jgi:hypothetical protein
MKHISIDAINDRHETLDDQGMSDIVELSNEMAKAGSDGEQREILKTMIEIIFPECLGKLRIVK